MSAIDRPRWLAQQLLSTEQEVSLVVKRITRARPQGAARNWLELLQDLLRRGRAVSLCLLELPLYDRTQPELIGLRNHLHLLAQDYGLQLFTINQARFPFWHLLIDAPGRSCRAIRLEDEDCALDERTGASGLLTTINREAVQQLAADLSKLPRRIVPAAALAPPPNVRILHLRDGEPVTEAGLFGAVFRAPLITMHINDRYLRSPHHEKRLRAYLRLVSSPTGHKPTVTITTMPAEEQRSGRQYYQTSAEQRQMFARLQQDFPQLALLPRLERQLPHDRFLELTRADGTHARIGIGVGLDFIQPSGRARATDILIEDPFDKK